MVYVAKLEALGARIDKPGSIVNAERTSKRDFKRYPGYLRTLPNGFIRQPLG
jgi:hypothetical protein